MWQSCRCPWRLGTAVTGRKSQLVLFSDWLRINICPKKTPEKEGTAGDSYPIGSMVLVYMLTLGYIDGIYVSIYSIHGSYGYGFMLPSIISCWGKHEKTPTLHWSSCLEGYCPTADQITLKTCATNGNQ